MLEGLRKAGGGAEVAALHLALAHLLRGAPLPVIWQVKPDNRPRRPRNLKRGWRTSSVEASRQPVEIVAPRLVRR